VTDRAGWAARLSHLLFSSEAPGAERAARGVLAFGLLAVCLALMCSFTLPILGTDDERPHVAYTASLLDGRLPEIDDPTESGADRFVVLADDPPPRTDIYMASHPPLAHAMAAPFSWLAVTLGWDQGAVMVMRFVNVLGFGVAVMASAAVTDGLFPGRRRLAVGASGLVSLTPYAVFWTSFGLNDGTSFAFGAIALAAGLRVVRTGPSAARLAWLVGGGTAAVATRSAHLPTLLILTGTWVAACALRRRWRWAAGGAVAMLGVPALAIGWFYVRSNELYGSITASSYLIEKFDRRSWPSPLRLVLQPRVHLGLVQGLWGGFNPVNMTGSGFTRIARPWADLGTSLVLPLALLGGAAVGVGRRAASARRHGAGRWTAALRTPAGRDGLLAWLTAAAVSAGVLAGLLQFVSQGGTPHPRYLFPALPVIGAVLVWGLDATLRRFDGLLAALVALFAVDLFLIGQIPVSPTVSPLLAQPSWSRVVIMGLLAGALVAGSAGARALRAVPRGEDDLGGPTVVGPSALSQ
jgi:hypothetical protein